MYSLRHPIKKRADSINGFDFTKESLKSNFEGLDYGITQRVRKIFDIIKSRNNVTEHDEDLVVYNVPYGDIKRGYPRQSYMNLTIGKLMSDDEIDDDIEDELESDLEKQLKNMLNLPTGVKIYKVENPNKIDGYENRNKQQKSGPKKSENFEVLNNQNFTFLNVGGYQNVKDELMQTVDILRHFEKYENYSVRTPKGLLLEGPPGNGKTLLAKGFSGEVNSSFIAVSGSQFTEKYVGVGASRIRELFKLADENIPCIIFVDEVDALGRSRSSSDQTNNPNTEAQSTLNELLVRMDGYESSNGVFIIAATNRGDLLDPALLRPGRIDKRIYIGNPDAKTREDIINIHLPGKPCEDNIQIDDLVEMTNGLSGAQIENLLNEGMLYALRSNRTEISRQDLDLILSRMLVGYQSSENNYSDDMIRRIAIHELGHAVVGIFSLHHANLVKICLNAWSPTSPGYTIFEIAETDSSIYTKEKLNSRLMVLLAGRIAEEIFFGASITSGASKDIEDAYLLAEQMIVKFGMGRKIVYPHHSEDSKNFIDKDIETLIESAYKKAREIVVLRKTLIEECSKELIINKILLPEDIYNKLN
jgi:cell division protease FtsH